MQSRDAPAQRVEARARQLGGGLELESAGGGADIDVVADGKGEAPRRSPAPLLDVVQLRFSYRHAWVRQVRHRQQPITKACLDVAELVLEGVELAAEAADGRKQRARVLSL